MFIVLISLFAILSSCTSERKEKQTKQEMSLHCEVLNSQDIKNITIPFGVSCLMDAYPSEVVGYSDDSLIFNNGQKLIYDDKIEKTLDEKLDNPDVEDMFYYQYNVSDMPPKYRCDPGRIRNRFLMHQLYGTSRIDIENNLVDVIWCPKLSGQILRFNKNAGAADALQKISNELDGNPKYKKYVCNASTYNPRMISKTNRISPHSFGIAIDISTNYSNYWQWSHPNATEKDSVYYKNAIPLEIVSIFEKNGFIWGGRWYHYDTMHFEYRPELMIEGN